MLSDGTPVLVFQRLRELEDIEPPFPSESAPARS